MSSETETLLLREETSGRRYPLFVERLFLILVVIGSIVLHPKVLEMVDGVFGTVVAWCGLPLFLLLCSELLGRIVQTLHSDS
ncbi:MAG: hypothetical protein NLN65_03980 [Candidatus Poseidoniaceae archaeon]|nr:hypothetical protein [Candidatus Poseidoniaceae archaeon]